MNLFNGRLATRIACKECGGLMQPEVPRHAGDDAIHFWCGTKLERKNDAVLHVPPTDNP